MLGLTWNSLNESSERARSWAVDQEEMRTFAGADGEDIDYEEFMEFQRKKAKEKAKQLSDLNKTQDRREREDDMAGTQHEEGIVRCPLPPLPLQSTLPTVLMRRCCCSRTTI